MFPSLENLICLFYHKKKEKTTCVEILDCPKPPPPVAIRFSYRLPYVDIRGPSPGRSCGKLVFFRTGYYHIGARRVRKIRGSPPPSILRSIPAGATPSRPPRPLKATPPPP